MSFRAIARMGARPDTPTSALAGSRFVWFQDVEGASAPTTDDMARLSRLRPDICGLKLDRPRIMGILNVTPDSFSDGGTLKDVQAAMRRAEILAMDADILDIGGESTRPGAKAVSVSEEIRRIVPVIQAIREAGITTPISIDTRKSEVACAALDAGANMVNDVSAFVFDPSLADLVAERKVPVCLMHSQGTPEMMQANPRYGAVMQDVFDHLQDRISVAQQAGIASHQIIVDPGIGFGKHLQHNLTVLNQLSLCHDLGVPLLIGASRKRFIDEISSVPAPKDRLGGSLAVALHAVAQGAHILRVHDTFETRQALDLFQALNEGEN